MGEVKSRILYHIYGFDGIKRFGPHRFGIESYYNNKEEAIRVAKNIADNIEDYDVPSQTIIIVKRCEFNDKGICIFEEEVWGSILGDMSESGLIPDMEDFLKSDEEENMFESKMKENKEFPGNDFHSRLCQFTYDTVDYFDLADAVGDYGDYPTQRDSIHAAIWDMSDEELIEGIKYGLEEGNLSYYRYPNLSLEDLENNAREDAKVLVDEYNRKYAVRESKISKLRILKEKEDFEGLYSIDQAHVSKDPFRNKIDFSSCSWSDNLGVLAGFDAIKDAKLFSTLKDNLGKAPKTSRELATGLNSIKQYFFATLKNKEFAPLCEKKYTPIIWGTKAKNILRHDCFVATKTPNINQEWIIIRLTWDEKLEESKIREARTKTLYYIYGFDGEKRFGPHNFNIEVFYDNKEEAISIAKGISRNINNFMVPEDIQIIVREEVYDKNDICISSNIIWSNLLNRIDESKIREYNSNNLNPIPKDFNFVVTTQFLEDVKGLGLTESDIEELKQSLKSRAPKASIGPNVYKFEWWPKRFNLGKKEGRVIYIEVICDSEAYLLKVYQKNKKKDLTLDEKNDIIESSKILNRNKEK